MALRILHVVPGLGMGGAETNLVRLLEACATGFEHQVIDLGSGGPMLAPLQSLGVPVLSVKLASQPIRALGTLNQCLQEFRPEIIHGWLYKGNLLASILGVMLQPHRVAPNWWIRLVHPPATKAADLDPGLVPVFWSVRHSLHAWTSEHPRLRLLVRLLAKRPFAPQLVIYNAVSSQRGHAELGYARYPSAVLGNFIASQSFYADQHLRAEYRQTLGVAQDTQLVGFVGRLHPLKNLPGFLATAKRLQSQHPEAQFVLAGQGLDAGNGSLREQLAAHGLAHSTLLLGAVSHPVALYNALDLLISPSLSEANSNVLLEAAASGCACIATNVGTAGEVLAPAQLVAGARDTLASSIEALAERLAAAALPLLQDADQREQCAQASQERVFTVYDAVALGSAYHRLYHAAAADDIAGWSA